MNNIKVLGLLLTISFVIAFNETPLAQTDNQKGYEIKGQVHGASQYDSVVLAYHYGDKKYVHDSAVVDNQGRFTFKGDSSLQGGIYLVMVPENGYFEIIVNDQHFSFETDTTDFVENFSVEGSRDNEVFYDYLSYIVPRNKKMSQLNKEMKQKSKSGSRKLKKQISALNEEVQQHRQKLINENEETFTAKLLKAMKEPQLSDIEGADTLSRRQQINKYRSQYLDNIDFSDPRMLRTPVLLSKMKKYLTQLTPQQPDSIIKSAETIIDRAKANDQVFQYVVIWITNKYAQSKTMGMDKVFVHMALQYYKTGKADWVDEAQRFRLVDEAESLKPTLIGNKAPRLVLHDTSGTFKNVQKMKTDYKVLFFYDPTCGHCKDAAPEMKDLYEKYSDKGVEFFGICTETEEKKWKDFIKEFDLKWHNLADMNYNSNFRKNYYIKSTPAIYLLDQNNEILAKQLSVKQLGRVINHYLNQ